MSIKFEGLEDVLSALEEIDDVDGLENVLGQACAVIERSAKQNAPKGTGELRRSITSEVRSRGDRIEGVVFTPLEYAPYVEYGTGLFAEGGNGRKDVPWFYKDDKGKWHITSGMKPQPFMRPAVEDNREQIIRIIREGIKNG